MKRDRDSAELDVPVSATGNSKQQRLDTDEEQGTVPVHGPRTNSRVRTGADCPYLDTISRQVKANFFLRPLKRVNNISWYHGESPLVVQNLDFDFEKFCSVSLSPVNVYACLVCGKYFQVRVDPRPFANAVVMLWRTLLG